MNPRIKILLLGILLLLALLIKNYFSALKASQLLSHISVSQFLAYNQNSKFFQKARRGVSLRFPQDHGAHPHFQNEWWYLTGNLQTLEGRKFSFQFTSFRTALSPRTPPVQSDWATNQQYMVHLGLTDIQADNFFSQEQFNRGALGLAGVTANPFKIWLDHWTVTGRPSSQYPNCMDMKIRVKNKKFSYNLNLACTKPLVLQGDRGFSKKSDQENYASYYYSMTRLATRGTITIAGKSYSVSGMSWMDHEWSSGLLDKNSMGWSWASLQLDDLSEVMVFRIQNKSGPLPAYGQVAIIDPQGNKTSLSFKDISFRPLDFWISPQTQVSYPTSWEIKIPKNSLSLRLQATMDEQEHIGAFFPYWEGAVDVRGTKAGRPISGVGFLELVGHEKTHSKH